MVHHHMTTDGSGMGIRVVKIEGTDGKTIIKSGGANRVYGLVSRKVQGISKDRAWVDCTISRSSFGLDRTVKCVLDHWLPRHCNASRCRRERQYAEPQR